MFSIEALEERLQQLIDQFEYEAALKFCQRILENDPNHLQTLETAGYLHTELNQSDLAVQFFEKVIEKEEREFSLLYLAQLSGGHESLGFLQRALAVLKHRNQQAVEREEKRRHTEEISGVYCLLTELYLTDCCFDEDAELKAGEYASEAIKWDSRNPDAYQAMASVLLSKPSRSVDAEHMLLHSILLWMPMEELVASGDYSIQQIRSHRQHWLADRGGYTGANDNDNDNDNEGGGRGIGIGGGGGSGGSSAAKPLPMPEYKCRMANAKLWTELGRYQVSIRVLETLRQERDEDLELWYLIAYNYYCDGARKLWKQATGREEEDQQQQQRQEEEQRQHAAIACFSDSDQTEEATEDYSEQIERCVQRVLDGRITVPDSVDELWAAGYECLTEARLLSEKNPAMMQEQDPEVVRQAVELYGLFERLFGSNTDCN